MTAPIDDFSGHPHGIESPPDHAQIVTASASPLPHVTRSIVIGTSGTVSLTTLGGETISGWPVVVGQTIVGRFTHVTASTGDVLIQW